MHDSEMNCIVANAFNGGSDSTGSDEYGSSIAWIDLYDYVETYGVEGMPTDSNELSEKLIAYMGGLRYVIATINSDGIRDAVGYNSRAEMMAAFYEFDAEFADWAQEVDSF